MKKLITCASVILAVCAVNAASFVWGFGAGDYEDINGNRDETYGVYTGGKAYLSLGTVTASKSAFDLSSATLVTSAGFDTDMYTYGYQVTDSPMSSDVVTSKAAGQAYSLILVDATDKDLASYEGNYVLYNGISTQGDIPGATVTHYAEFMQMSSPIAASDWATMSAAGPTPIPEPTSGLLMLLGMAGLALKRKRV